ncbi:uncharacterized protein N7515_000636 [Penicillium bovifimosum]|uniref:Uncharacterized protein n=1 Tax=Penicillium bovifimosum TaxID=126998 RepID=A0A9W9HIJ9_9EURO|nr:uncharacterized protein N7515_000636 [Penicillium bovifimosum]KAJ5146072.1 hypothetical protein N7515_000636 [Penicillium bovifimosum]
MPTLTSKARLFHLERLLFRQHCNDVALFILGNAELSIAELNDFIVELRAHVTVLWLAGNMLLRDCNPDDLAYLPPGFMTGMQPRLGRSPMTEFAWGCFYTRRELGWLHYQYSQFNDRLDIAARINRCGRRWNLAEDFPSFARPMIYPFDLDNEDDGGLLQLPHFQPSLQPR